MYENEHEVGDCLSTLGLARDDLFITTKVSPNNYAASAFLSSVEQSLKDLRLESG